MIRSLKIVRRHKQDEFGAEQETQIVSISLHNKLTALDKLAKIQGLYDRPGPKAGYDIVSMSDEEIRTRIAEIEARAAALSLTGR